MIAANSVGGSFSQLRDRHLFLFEGDHITHFHQRGEAAPSRHDHGRPPPERPRRKWATSGILHVPCNPGEEWTVPGNGTGDRRV